jgi:plasmid stabilization system protein ParE
VKVRYRARALADLDDIFRFLNEPSPTEAHNVLRAGLGSLGKAGPRENVKRAQFEKSASFKLSF